MELTERLKTLETVIDKHQDMIGKEARVLASEYSIGTAEEIDKNIEELENAKRLLKIGIVGRVKAGKSSLLNGLLFDGKPILPKAATPMTAALTVISYGEKFSAEVEFFSREDIEDIEKDAKKYEKEFNKLLKKEIEEQKKRKIEHLSKQGLKLFNKAKDAIKGHNEKEKKKDKEQHTEEVILEKDESEKIEKKVKRDLDKKEPKLSASFDQYQRMKASGINPNNLNDSKVVPFENLGSLAKELSDYVGSDGRYMPFTKSVHIQIPLETLKGIQIVDTPGVNDPVVSREERTREMLKECDVVFIVSPAGQFMSDEDLGLMDRITSKEGIRELYVIASKCDTQLHGSIKETSHGDLHKALETMRTDLAGHLHNTLVKLKKDFPEVGDAYDKLIMRSKESIIHSSGIAHTIKNSLDDLSALDSGTRHVWQNLATNYPDYFSEYDKKLSLSNLDLLSNMDTLRQTVEDVRSQKETILSARKEEFVHAKNNSFEKYKNDLIDYVIKKMEEINSSDLKELAAERKRLKRVKLHASVAIDEEYFDLVEELKIELKAQLNNELKSHFKEARRSIDAEESEEEEQYKVKKDGVFSWIAGLWGGGYETHTRTYTTVRAGAVVESLKELTTEIESSIDDVAYKEIHNWKKNLQPKFINTLRKYVDDEDLDLNRIRSVVRHEINLIEFPDLTYSNAGLPSGRGVLKKYEAEEFLDEVRDYVSTLRKRVTRDINDYLKNLISELLDIKISDVLFSEYDAQLEKLENEIKNREIALDRHNKLSKMLEEI